MQQIDHSLERPGMDYVDLIYQSPLGMPRILEEDMDVLHNLVKAGKVRYLDAIAMYA
nr:aldo/keto reductase [Bifidobacterium asteroides]